MHTKQSASLLELLLDAPEACVAHIQAAMRAVATGAWAEAGRLVGYAADTTAEGDAWGDLAATVSAELRARANCSC